MEKGKESKLQKKKRRSKKKSLSKSSNKMKDEKGGTILRDDNFNTVGITVENES